MKKSLILIPLITISLVLSSCSTDKKSSDTSSADIKRDLLQEAIDIQNASLSSSYVKIEILENMTTIYNGRSDNVKGLISVTKIKDDDEGWCYIYKDSDNHDVYHVSSYTYTDYSTYVYKEPADNAYYQIERELKPVTKDISKEVNLDDISIEKKEDGNLTTYTYRLTNFEDYFHQITNNEYKDYAKQKKLSLPDELVVYDYVRGGLIFSEQTTFTFNTGTKTVICSIAADFSYDGWHNLPQRIKDEINRDTIDNNLYNFKTSHILEIGYETNWKKLPIYNSENDSTGRVQVFYNGQIYYDGTKYLVYYDPNVEKGGKLNKIYVYDLSAMELLHTVTFRRDIASIGAVENGKIAVSLKLNNQKLELDTTAYGIYSLEDFSYLGKISRLDNGHFAFLDSYLYYGNSYNPITKSYDIYALNYESQETSVVYSLSLDDMPIDKTDFNVTFHKDPNRNLVFVYFYYTFENRQTKEIDYLGIDGNTNSVKYSKHSEEVYGPSADVVWLGNAVTFKNCTKKIEFENGEVSPYESMVDQYVFPDALKEYACNNNIYLNEHYDYVEIYKKSGGYNPQYWLYDKINNTFYIQTYLKQIHGYIIGDSYYLGISLVGASLVSLQN